MTQSALAAKLIEALNATAEREAGGAASLVSVTIDVLTAAPDASIDVQLVRKTRTLLFLRAEARSSTGAAVLSGASVHKVLPA